MPHKPTLREGACRINAPFREGHAAWEHFYKDGMPHPGASRHPHPALPRGGHHGPSAPEDESRAALSHSPRRRREPRRHRTLASLGSHRFSVPSKLILKIPDGRPIVEDELSSSLLLPMPEVRSHPPRQREESTDGSTLDERNNTRDERYATDGEEQLVVRLFPSLLLEVRIDSRNLLLNSFDRKLRGGAIHATLDSLQSLDDGRETDRASASSNNYRGAAIPAGELFKILGHLQCPGAGRALQLDDFDHDGDLLR